MYSPRIIHPSPECSHYDPPQAAGLALRELLGDAPWDRRGRRKGPQHRTVFEEGAAPSALLPLPPTPTTSHVQVQQRLLHTTDDVLPVWAVWAERRAHDERPRVQFAAELVRGAEAATRHAHALPGGGQGAGAGGVSAGGLQQPPGGRGEEARIYQGYTLLCVSSVFQ